MRPPVNFVTSKWPCVIVGAGFALVATYGLMGVLQVVSLFAGEHALRNVNLWGSLFVVSLFVSVFLVAKAMRVRLGLVTQFVAGMLSGVVAAWALWVLARHELAVDECLDKGGSFNYVGGVCDYSAGHPSLPLVATHGFVITLGGIACMATFLFLRSAHLGRRNV